MTSTAIQPATTTATAPAPLTARRKMPARDADESLYLLGRPKLKQFLRFVKHQACEPEAEETLIAEWHAAQRRLADVERLEAGCADDPVLVDLPVDETYEPLLTQFLRDPLVRNGFNSVPTRVAWVRLDQLVVYQKHIDLSYVRNLMERIGPRPDEDRLFRLCLPFDHPRPPARWSRMGEDSYVFVSNSNDMRFLGAMPLDPDHIRGYPHPGALLGVVGLAVGFGSNFLNAVWAEDRLILNNGSHRAYALRALGVSRVPCVVQHVSTRDELEAVASSEVRADPDLYLRNPRPPMLRDYFNPELIKTLPVRRVLRQIRLRFSVSEYFVPAL